MFCDGGVLPLAGGGELGLVLGGGGGFCSGAPPGCELGELGELAGAACWSEGGVLGLDDSLDGELELPGPVDRCEHAPTDSASAAAHSNSKLRFIRVTSQRSRRSRGSQAAFHRSPVVRRVPRRRSAGYFLAMARFFFLAGSLARDLPKEPR